MQTEETYPAGTRFVELCPRGFANEFAVYAVTPTEAAEVDAEISRMNNTDNGRARWMDAEWQPKPWQAIAWGDRSTIPEGIVSADTESEKYLERKHGRETNQQERS